MIRIHFAIKTAFALFSLLLTLQLDFIGKDGMIFLNDVRAAGKGKLLANNG